MIWKDNEQDEQDLRKKLNRGFCETVGEIQKFSNAGLLGFEDFFNRLLVVRANANYPHYNIEKISETEWCIVLAIAGFSKEDIDISLEGMQLCIKGIKPEENEEKEYIYKGIATRSFQRSFLLAEGIKIEKAIMENGLLKIYLAKPKSSFTAIKIPIE